MYLDLSYSKITFTQPNAWAGLDNLQTLKLDENNLNEIPTNLPQKLVSLDLSGNSGTAKTIVADSFSTMRELKNLNLHNANIQTLYKGAFEGIEQLETLNLGNNMIGGTSIPAKAFDKLHKLRILLLGHNKMSAIRTEDPLFRNLSSLETLDLSYNDCSEIPTGFFQGLSNLRMLFLQGNKLGSNKILKADLFKPLRNVTWLQLDNNGIRSLPTNIFLGMQSLQTVSLANNLISSFPQEELKAMPHLKSVDLSYNMIAFIEMSYIKEIQGRRLAINLTGNPWDCYCDLIPFRQWIAGKYNIQFYIYTEFLFRLKMIAFVLMYVMIHFNNKRSCCKMAIISMKSRFSVTTR